MDSGDSNTVDKYNKTRSVKEEDQAFDMKPFQQLQQNTRVCHLPAYDFHLDGGWLLWICMAILFIDTCVISYFLLYW